MIYCFGYPNSIEWSINSERESSFMGGGSIICLGFCKSMLNYFSTNLATLHKKHMLKICNRTLAGAVSNGAHGQVSHAFTGIVTLFARTFFITVRTFIFWPAYVKSKCLLSSFVFLVRSFSTTTPLGKSKPFPAHFVRCSVITPQHFSSFFF